MLRSAPDSRPTPPAEPPAAADPRPAMPLPAAGPPTALLAIGTAVVVIGATLALHGGRSDTSGMLPARAARGMIASLPLPGADPAPAPERAGPPLPADSATPFGRPPAPFRPSDMPMARPAWPAPTRFGSGGALSDDPRMQDFRNRGGYTPGARAEYVGGAGLQAAPGRAGDLAIVGDEDEPGTAAASSAAGAGEEGAIRASIVRNQAYMIAAGDVIHATLETPIDTAQPGLIRAIVAEDVRSFDGRTVLIARGSRLIGEARVNQQAGQHRVLALWSRLIRPDGVAIRINSQAGDPLGGNGILGNANSRFLARFANAVLQTAMQVGVNLAGRGTNVYLGGAMPGGGAVAGGIIPGADLPPTVRVKAGASVSVLVARDLDFSRVPRL